MAATGAAIAREARSIATPPLRVSFSWTLAGNAIYAACQFGMLSALAKFGSPSIVGQYALALAITAPVFMLANLQLRGVQVTDAKHEFEFADYFTLRTTTTLLALTLLLIFAYCANYDVSTKAVIALVACAKAIESFADVIAGHLQKFERLDQVARALMIRGTISLIVFTAVFWTTRNLLLAVGALAVTWACVVACYDFRIVLRLLEDRAVFFDFSGATMRHLTWLSLPLGIAMALNSLSTNLPRYILQHKLGSADLGIFASLAYLVTAVGLIAVALGQSVSARLSRLFADGNIRTFKTLMTKLILFAMGLGIVGVGLAATLGRPVLTLVYRPEYASHVDLLVVMVIDASIGATACFLGFGMTAARCFRAQIPITLVNVVATIYLAMLLIPRFGLLGGGYALLLSSMVQVCASYIVLQGAISHRQAEI
jgi:O-antigen/teichoic acid export membrane protein